MFYPSVSVGSSAVEAVFAVLHLGRMENDIIQNFLPNLFCSCFINCQSVVISPVASFSFWLLRNGLWSENIGTDVFRCGVDYAHLV